MNALILAAGFGTRLLPYTRTLPKPLFTLNQEPLLGHAISSLEKAGCQHICINTHHLSDQINSFINSRSFSATIQLIHEPEILDTGGAIANATQHLRSAPFFVINSDIINCVDLKAVYDAHLTSSCLATLVLHDYEEFNKIKVDDSGFILNFNDPNGFAFTGIQVLSPSIFDHFPEKDIFSSIDVYKDLSSQNQVKAYIEKDIFWSDIGTIQSYSLTSLKTTAGDYFKIPRKTLPELEITPLSGDGSDRKWYRATYQTQTCILCDHGINLPDSQVRKEMDAFIKINTHCLSKGLNLPKIHAYDFLSGIVALDDLGDIHLETVVELSDSEKEVIPIYQPVIDQLIEFSSKGINGFNTDWTCQTPTYSKELIIENECLYFLNAFITNYKKINVSEKDFIGEFNFIAQNALKNATIGLMHRDFQSRNIMINHKKPFFIDFQSARIGPIEYDLASLLIDPYVNLDQTIQTKLLAYTIKQLGLDTKERKNFEKTFSYCCITRNLQMLGAFSFLSREKGKTQFETYIPLAVNSLKRLLQELNTDKLPLLSSLVKTL